jgi:hypothetical protein
VTAIAGNQITV